MQLFKDEHNMQFPINPEDKLWSLVSDCQIGLLYIKHPEKQVKTESRKSESQEEPHELTEFKQNSKLG